MTNLLSYYLEELLKPYGQVRAPSRMATFQTSGDIQTDLVVVRHH